jgi:hypothetical protein
VTVLHHHGGIFFGHLHCLNVQATVFQRQAKHGGKECLWYGLHYIKLSLGIQVGQKQVLYARRSCKPQQEIHVKCGVMSKESIGMTYENTSKCKS